MNVWMDTIEGTSYLKKLAYINGTPLLKHRRKTFVLGFISALTSIKNTAIYLLTKDVHSYSFFLPMFSLTNFLKTI